MKLVRRLVIGFSLVLLVLSFGAIMLAYRPIFGWQTLSVPTGSMRPAISVGSLVLVHRVPESSLKIGDVITYINPSKMKGTITHRIVKINQLNDVTKTYTTKGDANKSSDPLPAIGGLIQGREVASIPYLGSFLMWAKTWVGIAILIYIPTILLMAEEVKRLAEYLGRYVHYRLKPLPKAAPNWAARRIGAASAAGLAVLILGLSLAPTALALLQSNTVALTNNTLSVAPKTTCSNTHITNNTSVTVTNTSNQTASSGNASNSNNTSNTGTTTTGNTSNSNNTSTSITITNGC